MLSAVTASDSNHPLLLGELGEHTQHEHPVAPELVGRSLRHRHHRFAASLGKLQQEVSVALVGWEATNQGRRTRGRGEGRGIILCG